MTENATRRPERITVGIDGSLASRAAVRWAVEHARPGDSVTLVHVWRAARSAPYDGSPAPDGESLAEHFAAREFQHARALPRDPRVRLSYRVQSGDAWERLAAEEADLLVVGAARHGWLAGRLLGSVSARIGQRSHAPVVVVPCPATHSEDHPASRVS